MSTADPVTPSTILPPEWDAMSATKQMIWYLASIIAKVEGMTAELVAARGGGPPRATSLADPAASTMTHASSTPVPDVSCSNIQAQEVLEVIHDAPLASIAMAHTTCSTECSTQVVAIASVDEIHDTAAVAFPEPTVDLNDKETEQLSPATPSIGIGAGTSSITEDAPLAMTTTDVDPKAGVQELDAFSVHTSAPVMIKLDHGVISVVSRDIAAPKLIECPTQCSRRGATHLAYMRSSVATPFVDAFPDQATLVCNNIKGTLTFVSSDEELQLEELRWQPWPPPLREGIMHLRHMFRPRPWPWFKYHLDAGCLEEPCSGIHSQPHVVSWFSYGLVLSLFREEDFIPAYCCDMIPREEPFSCLQNSYLATVAAHLFQSMQKIGALSIDYSNNIFVQFIHVGPYELVCAPAAVVYLFEDYLRPVNLELPQEWPPLVKSNSSELCSFKLWSSMGLQLIQFEPLLSSGPTSITEQWQLNCDKHADVRTIPWHEQLQWTVQIMSVSTHWQFLSQEEFKWNVQCRPEQLAGVLRARIQLVVLINFEYCSFKFRPDLILLVWPPARERTPEVKFSFVKTLFADAHAQDIRSACYMICRCTLSKFMRSPGYTAQPTFEVTKLQLTETLSLSSCCLWSELPSKVIHRKKFNYKDLQSYSCYVLQSQEGTECLVHCNVSYEFYLQKFALVWKVDRSGSNNSALRVITSLVHIRNTCSFWNMLVRAWRSRGLSVEKLQGEIPSCDILVLTWLGSSTSYKSCACFTDNKSTLASSMLIQIELELLITPLGEHMPLLQPKPPWSPLVPPKFTSEFGSNMRTNSESLRCTGVLLEFSQFWVLADLISSSSNYWWRFSCGTHPDACLTIALDWFGYILNELLQEGMSWDFGSSATYCDLRAMNSSSHNCPSAFIVMRQFNYGLLSVFDLYLLHYSSCKFPCCMSEAFNSEGGQSNEQCAVKLVLPVLSSYEQWDPGGLKFGDVEENWHRLGGKPVVKGEGMSASLLSWADSYGLGPATSLPRRSYSRNNYKYQDRDTGRGIQWITARTAAAPLSFPYLQFIPCPSFSCNHSSVISTLLLQFIW